MHGLHAHGHYIRVACVAIPCVTIPRVAHDKLHAACMFHAMRKRGSRKHVTGIFKDLSWCNACKNEVITERYRTSEYLQWEGQLGKRNSNCPRY